jgi:hypothetical protein
MEGTESNMLTEYSSEYKKEEKKKKVRTYRHTPHSGVSARSFTSEATVGICISSR